MIRRVEIVTVCEHGKAGKHLLAEKRFDGCDQCRSGEHGCGNPHFDCPGGSRRALEPGEFVLVEKVDGIWPMTNRVFNAIEDALVRETGSASMRTIETVVETYLDALAGGEV